MRINFVCAVTEGKAASSARVVSQIVPGSYSGVFDAAAQKFSWVPLSSDAQEVPLYPAVSVSSSPEQKSDGECMLGLLVAAFTSGALFAGSAFPMEAACAAVTVLLCIGADAKDFTIGVVLSPAEEDTESNVSLKE